MKNVAIKMSEKGKKRRKQLRSVKKGFLDTEEQKEGVPLILLMDIKNILNPKTLIDHFRNL